MRVRGAGVGVWRSTVTGAVGGLLLVAGAGLIVDGLPGPKSWSWLRVFGW
ncbi:hypothetical protein [Streptomyces daliensis]|uniref:Uncharacterized protein n=1 Tax=Streptomyces daliensis TaxID=299421 RepID=A0A8T4IIB4_9ACTN|nr:hypothetical protein [Streptomyces daliensis]